MSQNENTVVLDYDEPCYVCGEIPTLALTGDTGYCNPGLCGVCCFGSADWRETTDLVIEDPREEADAKAE